MALPAEIDNQVILGTLVDRLRPGAAWRRCDDLATLTATWEDQVQTLPTEQEFTDEYALYQADLAAEAAVEQVKSDAQAGFASIPGWASWDEATALAWVDNNITTPLAAIPDEAAIDAMSGAEFQAAAKDIIADQRAIIADFAIAFRNVAKAIVYLRNETWPNLQE